MGEFVKELTIINRVDNYQQHINTKIECKF